MVGNGRLLTDIRHGVSYTMATVINIQATVQPETHAGKTAAQFWPNMSKFAQIDPALNNGSCWSMLHGNAKSGNGLYLKSKQLFLFGFAR